MWGIIATWNMAYDGVSHASKLLKKGEKAGDAIEQAIKYVEDFPFYKSVGYGGLPNEEMIVELDAAYMDGDDLSFGAVGAIKDFANPIMIARRLSLEPANNFLVGYGAEKYAHHAGFERKTMLTDRAKIHYYNRRKEIQDLDITPYTGHDTVGMVALDQHNSMVVGTSTSGLFMKHSGRLGDSPVVGSGFYVDSQVGGATITGMGEDVMKGCLSFEVVRLMRSGLSPQNACNEALTYLDQELQKRRGLARDISIVALNAQGAWGVASNIPEFSFVVATETLEPTIYLTRKVDHTYHFEVASQKWIQNYMTTRTAPLERK